MLTEISLTTIEIRIWIRNYIDLKLGNIVTDPCTNGDGGLIEHLLNLGHE